MYKMLNKFWEVWGQSDSLYNKWANKHNINNVRLFVLYTLDRNEALTQKTISLYTGLAKQTVSSVIQTLKKENIIILLPSITLDKREKLVVLTDKGKNYCKELLTPLYEVEEKTFKLMGEDRVEQMIDSINLFNTILEREMKKSEK